MERPFFICLADMLVIPLAMSDVHVLALAVGFSKHFRPNRYSNEEKKNGKLCITIFKHKINCMHK